MVQAAVALREGQVADVHGEVRRVQSQLGERRGHGIADGRSAGGVLPEVLPGPGADLEVILTIALGHVGAVDAEALAADRVDDVPAVGTDVRAVQRLRVGAGDRHLRADGKLAAKEVIRVAVRPGEHEAVHVAGLHRERRVPAVVEPV